MSLTVVTGDGATTTALALTVAAPAATGRNPIILEADRTGGSLAAWLDIPITPSLSTVVASQRSGSGLTVDAVLRHVRVSPSGVSLIPCPVRAVEADRAVEEAERLVFPALADAVDPLAAPAVDLVADIGTPRIGDRTPFLATVASTIVVSHFQDASSAAAASVRIERLAERVERIAGRAPIVLAIVGEAPFPAAEIAAFVGDRVDVAIDHVALPVDSLAATTLAGRPGVSARRLERLPLIRAAAQLATAATAVVSP